MESDPAGNEPLYPGEEQAVETVSPHRDREFRAGRAAARAALASLGLPHAVLIRNPDRLPGWPPGFVGSISHCPGFCAAAVARRLDFVGVGFDVEVRRRVGPRLHPRVCTERERAWMADRGDAEETATLIFSAKEAVYKFLSPLTGVRLRFADVEVGFADSLASGDFVATIDAPLPPSFQRLAGRFAFEADHVLTAVALAA